MRSSVLRTRQGALWDLRPALATVFSAFALTPAATAGAQSFDDVFFFGDSLSDTGSPIGCAVVGQFEDRYFPGRCSNGPVWSEAFAAALGHGAGAAPAGGDNYAVGGAEALSAELGTVSLADQIDAYLLSTFPFGSDSGALYVIWIGGNDVLELAQQSAPPASEIASRVGAVIDAMERLHDDTGFSGSGAREFLVPNLPDLGRTHGDFSLLNPGAAPPWSDAQRATLSSLSAAWNQELAMQLDALPASYQVFSLDLSGLLQQAASDPQAFGISPAAIATSPGGTPYPLACLSDPTCAAASPQGGSPAQGSVPDGFLLFDGIHPTATGHAEIAQRALVAVAEPTTASAAGAAAGCLAALRGRRRRRSQPRGALGRSLALALVGTALGLGCATPTVSPEEGDETSPARSQPEPVPSAPATTNATEAASAAAESASSDPDAPKTITSPLGYEATQLESWALVDRAFLRANPEHANRATAAAAERGQPTEELARTFQQIAIGRLEIYFLPHPAQRDTIEVRSIAGTIPTVDSEVDAHCKDVRARIEEQNPGSAEIDCVLTKYGPNRVFIVQNAKRPDVEVTIFQLQRPLPPDAPPEDARVLTFTARLDPRTSLRHASAIRYFIAGLKPL